MFTLICLQKDESAARINLTATLHRMLETTCAVRRNSKNPSTLTLITPTPSTPTSSTLSKSATAQGAMAELGTPKVAPKGTPKGLTPKAVPSVPGTPEMMSEGD